MHTRDYSEDTSQVIDDEVERILRAQEERALEVLSKHRGGLDAVARALLDKETIDGERSAGWSTRPTAGRCTSTASRTCRPSSWPPSTGRPARRTWTVPRTTPTHRPRHRPRVGPPGPGCRAAVGASRGRPAPANRPAVRSPGPPVPATRPAPPSRTDPTGPDADAGRARPVRPPWPPPSPPRRPRPLAQAGPVATAPAAHLPVGVHPHRGRRPDRYERGGRRTVTRPAVGGRGGACRRRRATHASSQGHRRAQSAVTNG